MAKATKSNETNIFTLFKSKEIERENQVHKKENKVSITFGSYDFPMATSKQRVFFDLLSHYTVCMRVFTGRARW